MEDATRDALVDCLSRFETLVEVGIGNRTSVAAALAAAGATVTATDLVAREVPSGVGFVRDDVTDPDSAIYAGADALYALNLPPELQHSALAVAREHDVELHFTTLGTDPAEIPAEPETLPGETLFRATRR